jgi:hypothetical protein
MTEERKLIETLAGLALELVGNWEADGEPGERETGAIVDMEVMLDLQRAVAKWQAANADGESRGIDEIREDRDYLDHVSRQGPR